jgi:hypothetical protein
MEAYHILWGSALILASILAPGFALTFAVFPLAESVKWAERLGLALVFGMVPELLLYFLTKNLSVPVTVETSQLALAAVTGLGILVYVLRTRSTSTSPANPARQAVAAE